MRESYTTLWGQYAFNHSRPELAFDRRLEINEYLKLSSLWGIWTGVGHRFQTLDDRETRGGPAYERPWEVYGWFGGETDTARRLILDGTLVVAREDQAISTSLDGNVRLALWDRLSLVLYARWRRTRDYPRWVETVEGASRDRYIFGDLDHDELELKLTATLGLHRDLTLQLFAQLLRSVGTHARYRELQLLDDGATTLGATSRDSDADFASLSLIGNAILRWDLGGGAAAYLVYKLEGWVERDGRPVAFDLGDSLRELGRTDQTQLLLLKASYGWDL